MTTGTMKRDSVVDPSQEHDCWIFLWGFVGKVCVVGVEE
jgi:hypothetical protein